MSGFISLETSEISVSESDGVARIVIVREGDDSQDVVVNFETVPGSAGASDFTGITGTVTIPAGEDRAVIEIPRTFPSRSAMSPPARCSSRAPRR
jgi:hypothetical protein